MMNTSVAMEFPGEGFMEFYPVVAAESDRADSEAKTRVFGW